ncbi:MAG: hypothetical protein KIH01_08160 [Candidatus Freyarchaeota archaeon]|nr:hypothetical protein [Candidatus Jordarchaeia archaeon]
MNSNAKFIKPRHSTALQHYAETLTVNVTASFSNSKKRRKKQEAFRSKVNWSNKTRKFMEAKIT